MLPVCCTAWPNEPMVPTPPPTRNLLAPPPKIWEVKFSQNGKNFLHAK